MAFNGSGVFNRIYNWVNDKSNNINITASRFDTEDGGFAVGLSNCICKDGQQTTTALIPFAQGLSIPAGLVGTPGLVVIGDTTTGFYQVAPGAINFTSEGTLAATLNTNGLDATVVGGGTPAAGYFTTLAASSNATVGGTLAVTGHVTLEGVTSAGATGTGNLVFATSPTLTTAVLGSSTATTQTAGDNSTKVATTGYVDRGSSGAAMVLLGTASASNSASVAFTSIPGTYDQYKLLFTNIIPQTTNAILYMELSENNGSSFLTNAYTYGAYLAGSDATSAAAGTLNNAGIPIGGGTAQATTAGTGCTGFVYISSLGSSTLYKTFYGQCASYVGSNKWVNANFSGNYNGDVNVVNAFRLIFSTGNITSGNFALYGIRNS